MSKPTIEVQAGRRMTNSAVLPLQRRVASYPSGLLPARVPSLWCGEQWDPSFTFPILGNLSLTPEPPSSLF